MTRHVATAVHGDYVVHSAALAHSIVVADGDGEVLLHVMHTSDLTRRGRRRLERAMAGAAVFHHIESSRVADLPVRGYFTHAMWFRILLPELLAEPRAVYLDADTLVLDDIAPLWAIDLGGALVGATTNVFDPMFLSHPADLGIPVAEYFNSGVLLLDLDALRREGAMAEVREVARSRAGLRGWPDQDALNLVLGRRRHVLHPRYNAQNGLFALPGADDVFGPEAAAEARAAPVIRHFEGPHQAKPWHRDAPVAHTELWRSHQRAARLGRIRG